MTLGDEETGEEEGCEKEVSCCAKAIGGSSTEEPPGYGDRTSVVAITVPLAAWRLSPL
jgi:hypothetical protein